MYAPSIIDPALDDRLRADVEPGERLVWTGQPRRGAYARRMLPAGIAGLAFLAFGIGAGFMVATMNKPIVPPPEILAKMPPEERAVWERNQQPDALDRVLPFIFAGGFGLFGLPLSLIPLMAWFAAGRTAYAITDRGVIVQQGKLTGGYVSLRYHRSQLTSLQRTERSGGVGDLEFVSAPATDGTTTTGRGGRAPNVKSGFFGIDGVREVEQMLKKTLRIDESREAEQAAAEISVEGSSEAMDESTTEPEPDASQEPTDESDDGSGGAEPGEEPRAR